MVAARDIQALADRIAAEFRPRKIILFGSHAYGTPGPDSDVDLLIVMPVSDAPFRQAVEILSRTNPGFPIDLIVRDPSEMEWRYRYFDPLIRHAVDRGRVLYEAAA